jgi:hypothetical protein
MDRDSGAGSAAEPANQAKVGGGSLEGRPTLPTRTYGSRPGPQRARAATQTCPAEVERGESGPKPRPGVSAEDGVNLVKVFSATKAWDREELGDRITEWIRPRPGVKIIDTIVQLTSGCNSHPDGSSARSA